MRYIESAHYAEETKLMREHPSGQATFDFTPVGQRTVDRVDALERIVDALPARILHIVEADLTERATHPDRGRRGMSADRVLRAALLKQMNGVSYENLYFQIDDSNRIRRFVGYEFEAVPAASTLHENISAIRDETWEEVNDALVRFAVKERIEDLGKIRIDTANVEADIHHPTDASLLADGIRVIARICKQAKKRWPILVFDFHDRTRASKKLAFKIANAKSADRKTKRYRKLVPLAKETLGYGREAIRALRAHSFVKMAEKADAMRVAEDLKEICDLLQRVIDQTRRRVFEGESVPADEKVVSIFEPYACILEKGKRDTEFGRKVCLSMGKKLILDMEILDGDPAETEPFADALKRLIDKFRVVPGAVATDQGFGSAANAEAAVKLGVDDVYFSGKPVAASARHLVVEDRPLGKALGRFRAGAEGLISAAMRAGAKLGRCLWKGYDHFCAYAWSAVAATNVKRIAEVLVERVEAARKKERQRRRPALT